jgi:uncharacterized protein involved in exopolysaccharide biosynthesis
MSTENDRGQAMDDEPQREPTVTLRDILPPIWRNRKIIVYISAGLAVFALLLSFLFPRYYKSTATLLPEADKNKLSGLGDFSGLASLAGVNVGGSDLAKLYPTIVQSETILRTVIEKKYLYEGHPDSVNLITVLDIDKETHEEDMKAAVKEVTDLMTVSFESKTNVVHLSLEMPDRHLSADVLNAVIAELDTYMREKRKTNASEQRKWISVRITEVEGELKAAEDTLKNFREKNRRVVDSPQLLLEQERLMRDVQVKATVYVELKKQVELARIDEIKNIPIVNVLDPALPPVKKERPKRLVITLATFLLAFAGSSTWFVVRERYAEKIRVRVRQLIGRQG